MSTKYLLQQDGRKWKKRINTNSCLWAVYMYNSLLTYRMSMVLPRCVIPPLQTDWSLKDCWISAACLHLCFNGHFKITEILLKQCKYQHKQTKQTNKEYVMESRGGTTKHVASSKIHIVWHSDLYQQSFRWKWGIWRKEKQKQSEIVAD